MDDFVIVNSATLMLDSGVTLALLNYNNTFALGNGTESGRTYVFMGGPTLTDGNAALDDGTLTGEAASDGFGSWVVGSR